MIVIALLVALLGSAYGCSEGNIRLYGGYSDRDGMVQQCNSTGGWEAVCDRYWYCDESAVACNQLGYNNAIAQYNTNYGPWPSMTFGPYSCSSPTNTSLDQCDLYSHLINTSSCRPQYDTVYLLCAEQGGSDGCTDGDVRLVNGTTSNEGRVEYCNDGTWRTLCTRDYISRRTASIICNELGYVSNSYGLIFNDGTFGRGDILRTVYRISCYSNDHTLDECYISHSEPTCTIACSDSYNHYGLRCYEPTGCSEGGIQLADGVIENEGRVEICVNGVWSSICDYGYHTTNSRIICNELGLSDGAITYYNSAFGGGYGPIVFSNVDCEGHEQSITECTKSTYFQFTCYNTDTVGVLCVDGCKEGDVRIRSGKPYGTVEVCVNEIWGLIGDEGWDNSDATVVCRQLGYGSQGLARSNSTYGKPRRAIHFNNVHCIGDEDHILDCNYQQYLLDEGKSLIDGIKVVGVDCGDVTITSAPATVTPGVATSDTSSSSSQLIVSLLIIVIVCLVILIVAVILSSIIILLKRNTGTTQSTPSVQYIASNDHENDAYYEQVTTNTTKRPHH